MAGKNVSPTTGITVNSPSTNFSGKLNWDPAITNPLFADLIDLLKCHQCKKLSLNVYNLSKCSHILCGECKHQITNKKCSICSLQTMEMKKDFDYERLIKDLRLLNQHFLKIKFVADNKQKSGPTSAVSTDLKKATNVVKQTSRPIIISSPSKKNGNAEESLNASQDYAQTSQTSSIVTLDGIGDKKETGKNQEKEENFGSTGKRRGRPSKSAEKLNGPSKKQKVTKETNEEDGADGNDIEEEGIADDNDKLNKIKEKDLKRKQREEKAEAQKKEKELAKEKAKERAKEKVRERAREAREKAKEKAKEVDEEDREEKDEKDGDENEDEDKNKQKNRKKAPIKSKIQENDDVDDEPQDQNYGSSKKPTIAKKRGKKLNEDENDKPDAINKDKPLSSTKPGRGKKKELEEKVVKETKEVKSKGQPEVEEKRVTRSSPVKQPSSKVIPLTNETPRQSSRSSKSRLTEKEAKNKETEAKDTDEEDSDDEIQVKKGKSKVNPKQRKSVSFSPMRQPNEKISPRVSPRTNKGNMMYLKGPDQIPLINIKRTTTTTESNETETSKSSVKSAKGGRDGKAKTKAEKVDDDDAVFIKPRENKGKRGAASSNDTAEASPSKRIRKTKETGDENESQSSVRSTVSSRSTTSSTPRGHAKILVASTLLTPEQKKSLEKFKSTFNIRLTPEFPSMVTHLVTKSDSQKRATRSLKYMKALLTHKWILSFDWILDCLKAGKIIPEESYELSGTTKQDDSNLDIPKIARTSKKKLLAGIHFYFDGKFKDPNLPNIEELKDIVTVGGGTILDNNLKLTSMFKKDEKIIIIKDKVKGDEKASKTCKAIEVADLLSLITDYKVDGLFN